MTKTITIPQKNSYNLTIPDDYIGKKIEILLYALDEIEEDKKPKKKKQWPIFVEYCQKVIINH